MNQGGVEEVLLKRVDNSGNNRVVIIGRRRVERKFLDY